MKHDKMDNVVCMDNNTLWNMEPQINIGHIELLDTAIRK